MHHKQLFPALLLFLLLLCSCSPRLSSDELDAHAELLAEERGISETEARNILGEASYISLSIIGIKYLSCSDSDAGIDYLSSGKVELSYSYLGNKKTAVKSDYCIGNSLIEYFCLSEKRFARKKYQCLGECINSSCA